jgi:hypothetical protein
MERISVWVRRRVLSTAPRRGEIGVHRGALTMIETAHAALAGWENFYVIVGSSGAALIGLQFVVIALIKDTRTRTTSGTISAFGTPTVVHLGGALLVSAIMSAPWPSLLGVSLALVICGLIGLGFAARVIVHARRQVGYQPVMEDWLWYMAFPCCMYAAIVIGALLLHSFVRSASFVIAGAALSLLLIAIHNAWDTVTYIVLGAVKPEADRPK